MLEDCDGGHPAKSAALDLVQLYAACTALQRLDQPSGVQVVKRIGAVVAPKVPF